jgi:hypothetical protein
VANVELRRKWASRRTEPELRQLVAAFAHAHRMRAAAVEDHIELRRGSLRVAIALACWLRKPSLLAIEGHVSFVQGEHSDFLELHLQDRLWLGYFSDRARARWQCMLWSLAEEFERML